MAKVPEILNLACETYEDDSLILEVMRDGSGLVQVRIQPFMTLDIMLGATSLIRLQAWIEAALVALPHITAPAKPPQDPPA